MKDDPYICDDCGSKLKIIEVKAITSNQHELNCPICGGLLFEWDRATNFRAEVIWANPYFRPQISNRTLPYRQ